MYIRGTGQQAMPKCWRGAEPPLFGQRTGFILDDQRQTHPVNRRFTPLRSGFSVMAFRSARGRKPFTPPRGRANRKADTSCRHVFFSGLAHRITKEPKGNKTTVNVCEKHIFKEFYTAIPVQMSMTTCSRVIPANSHANSDDDRGCSVAPVNHPDTTYRPHSPNLFLM